MYFQINSLLHELNFYKNIMIYGTGKYAKCIYDILYKCGLRNNVTGFIVSDVKDIKMRELDGIPVISLQHLSKVSLDDIILIAVSKKYVEEIEQSLIEKGYRGQYLRITDYEKEDEDVKCWDINRNFQELYEYIVQWCASNQVKDLTGNVINSNGEFELAVKKNLCDRDRKQIIFIAGLINARISRIAISLKKIGFHVRILRSVSKTNAYVGEAELIRNGIELKECLSIIDLLFYLYKENPLVYCIDPPSASNEISRLMLAYKEYFGKIVLMPYDILNLSHILKYPQRYYELERYALENADGIVWRYFCKNELEEKLGWQYQGKSIIFLDYCKQYNLPPKNFDKGRVKLCCLPTHVKPFIQSISENSSSTREATVWEIMERIGNRSDCEFHVYFWAADEEDLRILEAVKKQYMNFYYYVHIDHEQLISQISQYDYGCDIFTEGTVPEYPHTIGVGLEHYLSEGVYLYASQNKYYDFLSANLPIIAVYPQRLCELLSRYGVIIDMRLATLDIQYLRENKEVFFEKAKKAHDDLLINEHIFELVKFFEKDLSD